MTVDREKILKTLRTWSSGEISDFTDLVEAENVFVDAFTRGGVFPGLMLELVELTREEIIRDPKAYLMGLLGFFRLTAGQGFPKESDLNAQIPTEMYIARLIASGGVLRGAGLNYLFTPGDPLFDDVAQLYTRNLTRLRQEMLVMPFTVLWCDGFYYRGGEITKGEFTNSDDCTFEFDHWEQTWSQIQTHAAIFRLGAPYIPPNAMEILKD